MEKEITAPPWRTEEYDNGDCWWLDDVAVVAGEVGRERTVCIMHGDSAEGDAAAIAAAPNLLAACEKLVAFWTSSPRSPLDLVIAADAAIHAVARARQ